MDMLIYTNQSKNYKITSTFLWLSQSNQDNCRSAISFESYDPLLYNNMSHIYNSTFRFTTLTIISKEDYRRARHIISHIIENPQSHQFREPVNWQGLNLIDYPQIIKNPMDLSTILKKIDEEQYQHVEEFLDDFQLIWDNCKIYNNKGTWIYGLADKLEKNGKKMLKNYFPSIPIYSIKNPPPNGLPSGPPVLQKSSGNQPKSAEQIPKPSKSRKAERSEKLYYQDEQQITRADKMRLADKFKTLSPSQNSEVVEYIKECCPTSFRQQEERVQIIVDNMDIITFKQIMEKIQQIESEGNVSESVKRIKLE